MGAVDCVVNINARAACAELQAMLDVRQRWGLALPRRLLKGLELLGQRGDFFADAVSHLDGVAAGAVVNVDLRLSRRARDLAAAFRAADLNLLNRHGGAP